NPNKRKAIFIYDTFLTVPASSKQSVSLTADVLGIINLGGAGEGGGTNPEQVVRETIGNIKKVKTRFGKWWNSDLARNPAYTRPQANLSTALERMLSTSITDLLRSDPGFDPTVVYVLTAKYATSIADARTKLTAATFDPDAMGVWGGA